MLKNNKNNLTKKPQTADLTHIPSQRRLWEKQTKPWLKTEAEA